MIDLAELMAELRKRHSDVRLFAEYDYTIMNGLPVLEINAVWKDAEKETGRQWIFTPEKAQTVTAGEMLALTDA